MTDLSEMDWAVPVDDPTRPERGPRRHRHVYVNPIGGDGTPTYNDPICRFCGLHPDPVISRRGRTNRSRGNAIEREVAARLGLARVGQFGGPDDVRGLAFVGQVKSGGAFPERLWRWLRGVPVAADQTRILVITDAPGPGHKRRGLVVLELDDWVALHGETLA